MASLPLMAHLFAGLGDGLTPELALARARAEPASGEDEALTHPFHWAAFQLYGR